MWSLFISVAEIIEPQTGQKFSLIFFASYSFSYEHTVWPPKAETDAKWSENTHAWSPAKKSSPWEFLCQRSCLEHQRTQEGSHLGYDFSFTIAQVISAVSLSYGNNPYPKLPTIANKFLLHVVVLAVAVTLRFYFNLERIPQRVDLFLLPEVSKVRNPKIENIYLTSWWCWRIM